MLFQSFFMCNFLVVVDGGRCFMSSNVRLVHVEKWPFLMARRWVFRTDLNSRVWYHYNNYSLVLAAR